MKRNFILVIFAAIALLLSGCDKENKPAKPGAITVTEQEDGTYLLSVAAVENATTYVWFRNDAEYRITEAPSCTVSDNGRYKVAGENDKGRGDFSDEVKIGLSFDDNILTEEHIPDAVFRDWINKKLARGSGVFTVSQAESYAGEIAIDEDIAQEIKSLQGIGFFTSLKKLQLVNCIKLQSAEHIVNLPELEYLKIMYSKCKEFDFTTLTGLQELHLLVNNSCKPNGIKVNGLSNLTAFTCNSNNIKELDLTGCDKLQTLICSYNNLNTEGLILPENAPISILAVHANPELTEVVGMERYKNTLTFLNISGCPITELDLTGMTHLSEYLDINGCGINEQQLKGLSSCTDLIELRIENNKFTSLDVSSLKQLKILRCDNNQLTTINLSQNSEIEELSLMDNTELSELSLEGLTKCWYLCLSRTKLGKIDLTPCTILSQFYCNGNAPLVGDEENPIKAQIKV